MPALIISIGKDLEELQTEVFGLRSDIAQLRKDILNMTLSQQDFDVELAELVAAVDQLIAAVEAIPPADMSAEGQAVTEAAQRVRDELNKLNPGTPEPPPETV